jgi:Amt family ammonium transporter
MAFVPLWLTFSYTVGAFSLWGGGFLFHWGVMDYSGGYVIHLSSGIAGLTTAFWVSQSSFSSSPLNTSLCELDALKCNLLRVKETSQFNNLNYVKGTSQFNNLNY